MIKFTPESPYDPGTLSHTEVNLTVTVTDVSDSTGSGDSGGTTTEYPVVIKSVTATDSGVSIEVVDNTFTVTGTFGSIFNTPINYLDSSNVMHTVASFNELPTAYNALTKFTSTTEKTKEAIFTVIGLDDTVIGEFIWVIHYNYATQNSKLKAAVKEGKF